MKVIGVGDADVDIYLDVPSIPGRDEKRMATSTSFYPGGMVANFLVVLSRLGTSCGFHGPVGDDEFGQTTLDDLQSHGVSTEHAIVKPGERTYFCVVLLDDSGEKSLIVAPTACLSPSIEEISEEAIRQATHLHLAASDLPTTHHVLALARKHGLTTSVDIEPDRAADREATLALLPMVDLLFINHAAARAIAGSEDLAEAAATLHEQGARIVCVMMGARGSLVSDGTERLQVPAFQVPVVDSTGAGDSYAAAFVHGFLSGWSLSRTATFATAVGALAVGARGGHGCAPTMQEVEHFLRSAGVAFPP